MNPHIFQGTIAFVLWATFSTWYYVSYIKEWPQEIVDIVASEEPTQPVTQTSLEEEVLPDTTSIIPIETIIKVDLSIDVPFLINQSKLTSNTPLKNLRDSLSKLQSSSAYLLAIEGHTCDLGPTSYNDSLGMTRAQAVADYLQSSLDKNIELAIKSLGERAPKAPNTNEMNRVKNRRVTITLTN